VTSPVSNLAAGTNITANPTSGAVFYQLIPHQEELSDVFILGILKNEGYT